MNTVQITLTVEDSELFKEFQKWHSSFTMLAKSGALGIKNGAFIAHLDNDGVIRKVERHDILYSS